MKNNNKNERASIDIVLSVKEAILNWTKEITAEGEKGEDEDLLYVVENMSIELSPKEQDSLIFIEIKQKDKYTTYKTITKIYKKVERIVQEGKHSGYNDNDEPIVIEYKVKPALEIIKEIFIGLELEVMGQVSSSEDFYERNRLRTKQEKERNEQIAILKQNEEGFVKDLTLEDYALLCLPKGEDNE